MGAMLAGQEIFVTQVGAVTYKYIKENIVIGLKQILESQNIISEICLLGLATRTCIALNYLFGCKKSERKKER